MNKRIAIDIDGVLADFTARYIEVINTVYPGRIPTGYQPPDWWWTDMLTKQETSRVWRELSKIECFWVNIPQHEDNCEALREFLADHDNIDVYFVTSRTQAGTFYSTLAQTNIWLERQRLKRTSTSVIIVPEGGISNKGHIYRAVNIEASIDDRDKNVLEAALDGPPGHQAFLLDRSWNKNATELDGWRVKDLREYLERIARGTGSHV